MGRLDLTGNWPSRRDRWVSMFRNREVHPGESVTKKVGAGDEWCAEAYMDTDYSKLSRKDFEKTVRDFAVFKLVGLQEQEQERAGENG